MNEEEMKASAFLNDESSVDDLGMIICEESELDFPRKKKKVVKPYFDGGSYLTNYPHFRDGWSKVDFDFYASLVTIKVQRKNRQNKLVVLDDIVEFRMLPVKEANELCDRLFAMDYLFVVYEGDEIRKKENDGK